MDFSKVKSLTIPEGSVTKITDSSGRVLWQKNPVSPGSWRTIWEGNINNSAGIKPTSKLYDLKGNVTLRVTWSYSASGGGDTATTEYYNNNGYNTTTVEPESPFQFEMDAGKERECIVGCTRNANIPGTEMAKSCFLRWSSYNKFFYLQNAASADTGDINILMTITKIEQYN